MAKKATTLFIRDTGIYLLVMKDDKVEKWASLPLEPGLVSQGVVVDETQVADKVRQIFKETGASTSKVTVGLSGHDSLYRMMTLPELPDAILPEAIRREIKRTIPTPLDEIYFSYQRLAMVTKGESRVFLATYPRNLVDALIRTLRKAGIRPQVMDLAPLALCRIPDAPRAITVNARLDHLDVMVMSDRLPQVIRRLVLPGEAESLEERLPLIAEEFNRTLAFYNSGHMENPLDSTVPVFVSGDLADKPETWQSVISNAGYTVSPLSCPVELPEGMNANDFLVNFGLALKELRAEKEGADFSLVNFNALPEAYVPPSFSIARVLVPVGLAVGLGLIALAVILILTGRASINTLSSEVTVAETNVAQLQAQVSNLNSQVKSAGATADELSSRLTNTERGAAAKYDDLDQVVKLAGGQVTLGNISHTGSSVSVSGTASSVDNVYGYARDLRSSKDSLGNLRFSRVWVNSIGGSSGSYSFSLTLSK
jgi:type IV pilus assembly protein PilM